MGRRNEATRDQFELKAKSRDPSYKRVMGNYPAKKYKKGTPAVTRLVFEFTGSSTKFIDIAAALSIVNRRLYRQGLYYYINSVEYYDNANNVVDVLTVPDTWTTKSSHRRAKGIFDEMNARAMLSSNTILPKYHDFKVYMDDTHVTNGSAEPSLYSFNSEHSVYAADDWQYSKITSADPNDQDGNPDGFYLHMTGGHNGDVDNWISVGVIKSYADTRREPQSSDPQVGSAVTSDPLVNLFDYSVEEQLNEIVQNLIDDNDATPYDANAYVGELGRSKTHVARLTTTEESGRVTTAPGFCAPCGLVMIDPQPTMASDNDFRIVLNLAVGTYHGVYAERI